jgi:hypothetical protein
MRYLLNKLGRAFVVTASAVVLTAEAVATNGTPHDIEEVQDTLVVVRKGGRT